jgi:intein/homing endonuclease
MPFKRYAHAILANRDIHFDQWMEEYRKQHEGAVSKEYVGRIAKTIVTKCDPKAFLLSHATIVASVDAYAPKNTRTGRYYINGAQIDVRYPDFRIKPECHKIINNNGDAWERSLLLATYRTFIGAPNYLEHIQLPELSKGFIIDAIARDLGSTCYVDILVATNKKHSLLINDILSDRINAMSMGCHEPDTPVMMEDGTTLPISEIRPEMVVLSQKGNPCRVDNVQVRENRWKMFDIKAVGLPSISSTDNHEYYIVQRDSVKYKKSCRGRLNPVPNDYPFDKVEVKDLVIGDIIATPIPQAIEDPGISESDARLIGLYVADGWKFDFKHDSTQGIGFCVGKSEEGIIEEIEKKIDQIIWASGEARMTVNGHTHTRKLQKRFARNACYLTITSRASRNLIDRFVIGRKAKEKRLTKSVLNWPHNLQLSLLGGIIDGDGCVSIRNTKSKTKSVHVSTRSKQLIDQLFMIAARCGVITTISKAKREGTKLVPGGVGIDYQLNIRNDCAERIPANKIGRFIGRFNAKAAAATGNKNRWITDGYLYSKIKSLKSREYVGWVYDLQVDDDHSYIASGMGVSNCISLFTLCTKCGNVAVDDSQLCPCILYEGKGTKFVDEDGITHPISELIGHVSVPSSNQFIEASWVKTPAFSGAARRNILNPDQNTVAAKVEEAASIYELRREIEQLKGVKKAASVRRAQDDPLGPPPSAEGGEPADEPPADEPDEESESPLGGGGEGSEAPASETEEGEGEGAPEDPLGAKFDELLTKAQEYLLESIVKGLEERLQPKPEDVGTVTVTNAISNPTDFEKGNDNLVRASIFNQRLNAIFHQYPGLIKWATNTYKIVHHSGKKGIAAKMTPRDLLIFSWIEDTVRSHNYSPNLYKVAMNVGPSKLYPSEASFLAACKVRMGRSLTPRERQFFSWKGKIASLSIQF